MLRVNTFELSGYTRGSSLTSVADNERIAELRTVIREAIARGVTLVLDRDRFMRRIVEVISESSGYPSVAAYLVTDGINQMSLVAATEASPAWLPRRLDGTELPDAPAVIDTAAAIGAVDLTPDLLTAAVPLEAQGEIVGYILVMDILPNSLTADDLEALGVVAEEISPAVRVAIHHHKIQQSSVVDIPTGAYTYDFFLKRLEEELARARRTGHSVTIVLVEIWHIEHVEASAGYEMADQLLRDLAARITALMRTSDVVARRRRTGFALLLPESDVEGAHLTVQRIEEQLNRVEANLSLGEETPTGPQTTVVAGSSTFPTDGQTSAELILAADQRMLAEADELETTAR